MAEDFYKILGVDKTATQEEIKKSYRNLVKKHHPDKGGDENTFKQIQSAFEVLGDPDKRKQYDNPSSPFQGFGSDDMMENIFSQFFGSGFPGGGFRQRFYFRGTDINLRLSITTKEAYLGGSKTFRYKRVVNGKHVDEVKTINIPKNCDNGSIFKIAGMGNGPQGNQQGEFGDLLLIVNLTPDIFTKEEWNLIYTVNVDPVDLLIGKEEMVPHYDGDIRVIIPPGSSPHHFLRVQGKGFRNEHMVGDLLIKLNVLSLELPEELKNKLKEFKKK